MSGERRVNGVVEPSWIKKDRATIIEPIVVTADQWNYFALLFDKIAKLGNGDHYGNSIGNDLGKDGLNYMEYIIANKSS